MMNRILKASVLASLCLGLISLTSCCRTQCNAPCQQVPCQPPVPYSSPCAMPEVNEPCVMLETSLPYAAPSDASDTYFMSQPESTDDLNYQEYSNEYTCPCQDKPPVSEITEFDESCECVMAPATHEHNQSIAMDQEICEQSLCGHCLILPSQNFFDDNTQTAQVENFQELYTSQE